MSDRHSADRGRVPQANAPSRHDTEPPPDRAAGDFAPTATWPMLVRRADLLRRTRAFFDTRGFVEVETPLLSSDTVVDRHLDPLSLVLFDDPREPDVGPRRWLQTSPEFGMKRLLAAGATAIYQIGKAFRGGERGPLHNPEFTMVEWYRVGDDYQAGVDLLADLTRELLRVERVERLTYRDAFLSRLGFDPHEVSNERLAQTARTLDLHAPEYPLEDRDSWLNLLLATAIEPTLGREAPTILLDYPASQAALARVAPGPPAIAERFELYVGGIELANGYHELLDPDALIARSERNNSERAAEGRPTLPVDSRLLAAMRAGLPPCAGVALGFDRLVLAATGARSLAEVLAFPSDRA